MCLVLGECEAKLWNSVVVMFGKSCSLADPNFLITLCCSGGGFNSFLIKTLAAFPEHLQSI